MAVSRRDFMKISGSTVLLGSLGISLEPAKAYAQGLRIKDAKETYTVCPYCSVGCGIIVHTKDGKVVNTEGDPDHPINEGTLCSKGASLYQIINNEKRVLKPRYRAAGATEWKEVEWDWTLDKIARNDQGHPGPHLQGHLEDHKVKEKLPDGTERETEKELTVNRTDGIAHVGSAALDNEECYMLQKMLRSWGVAAIEHQARI